MRIAAFPPRRNRKRLLYQDINLPLRSVFGVRGLFYQNKEVNNVGKF